MKTLLVRPLLALTGAASAMFLAGCLDQPRPAVRTVPPAASPVSEPQIVARPDPAAANVSAPVAEVARLHQAGLDETVVKAFVEKSTNRLSPTADELIYLKDIGVSPRIVTALIQQTARMREQAAAAPPANPPPSAAVARPNMTVVAANANPPAAPAARPVVAAPVVQPAPPPAPAVVVAPAPAPVAQPAPAAVPPQINVFYQQLQPYGTWMQVADYGWCWQPTVVVSTPSWRPYCDRGRWLYTNHGWYWQSDYAWGWAPFHYGRWVLHARSGWLWVPDTTWGPAWVVWRSSATHCGWAPLPPSAVFVAGRGLLVSGASVAFDFDFGLPRHHYTFVPFSRFCDRNPHYFALAPTVVQNVYNETTVINNIHVNNNVIVNGGVPADRVAVLTRSEIRKVSVREAAAEPNALLRLDRLEKAGNDLVIYRPVLNPNAPVKPMTLTNSRGESRTELVPAGALPGQKIAGRPVYDTTSTGVPVLTGYTTEPSASPAGPNTVIINNTVTSTPAPAQPTTPPANSVASVSPEPARPVKMLGISPEPVVAKRTELPASPPTTVLIPNPANNSLFRPLTTPQPVTSTPQPLTAPTPIGTSQPYARAEVSKTDVPASPASSGARLAVQPMRTSPPPAPPAPVAPAAPPRPTVTIPTPVQSAPAYTARPTVVVTPPPQPASPPASSGSSNPSKTDQERKK